MDRYDVVVAGASISGCTAAILMGQAGLRVALIERRQDIDAYRVLCTHYIQACATPTIRRLGLDERIAAAGGIRNHFRMWTRWGWIEPPVEEVFGYNIRRKKLDPLLRSLASETPGVELMLGQRVTGLVEDGAAVTGVRTRAIDGSERTIRARLVVGADGKHSTVAKLAAAGMKRIPNERFCYFAHFTGVELPHGTCSLLWMREPDVFYVFPNDAGITLLAAMPGKASLPAFKEDPERALLDRHRGLPGGARLEHADRVSKVIGTPDYPLVRRPAVPRRGVALIGDARLTSDPTWGVGCGWAFQTAEWLSDAVVPALQGEDGLDAALRRYRRACRALNGHQFLIEDAANGRPFNAVERLMFSAGVRDAHSAAHVEALASRRIPVRRFLSPLAVAYAGWVNVRHMLRKRS